MRVLPLEGEAWAPGTGMSNRDFLSLGGRLPGSGGDSPAAFLAQQSILCAIPTSTTLQTVPLTPADQVRASPHPCSLPFLRPLGWFLSWPHPNPTPFPSAGGEGGSSASWTEWE